MYKYIVKYGEHQLENNAGIGRYLFSDTSSADHSENLTSELNKHVGRDFISKNDF
jgi:hypothetical protein